MNFPRLQFSRILHFNKRFPLLLVLLLCVHAPLAEAQAPAILIRVGELLLHALKDYAIHEAIDRTVAFITGRKEVGEVEKSLRESLKDTSNKSEAAIADIREQLRAAQLQLEAFRRFDAGMSKSDAYQMQDEINASLGRVMAILRDHEERLVRLERDVDELKARLSGDQQHSPPESRNSDAGLMPPSFNCARAWTRPERLICGNAILADADGRLGKVYRQVLREVLFFKGQEGFYAVRNDERSWIRSRDQQLANDCSVLDSIVLRCALRIWERRTQELQQQLSDLKMSTAGR